MLKAAKIRLLLALAIIAAVVALAVVSFFRLPSTKNNRSTNMSPGVSADLALRGVRFTETINGSIRWVLLAERAEYDKSKKIVALATVRLTMTSADKSVGELVVDSAQAEYNTETKDVALRGGVKAKSSTGMKFTTETARFVAARGMLTTKDHVSFSDGKLSVQGNGMEFRVADADLRISENVTATVNVEKR